MGVGGIGIVRISGSRARDILERLFVPRHAPCPFRSHTLYYGTVIRNDGAPLDEVLAVYMRAPRTYTREDVVEIHSHGSQLVLRAVLERIIGCGARLAEPGEFTKRAFLAGRIDLTRAEAVIDLLQARTGAGLQLAANQLQGSLYDHLEKIRRRLVDMLAIVEVAIDFPEDDVEIVDSGKLAARLQEQVIEPLVELLRFADQGRVIREGVTVVIGGRPNVGKSSLLNALLREERALVAAVPGTTRDTIEETVTIHGIPVRLVDTAGIRDHDDPVEEMGIERARAKLRDADLVLFLVDGSEPLTPLDKELYRSLGQVERIVVINKIDIAAPERIDQLGHRFESEAVVRISARAYRGIEALRETIWTKIAGDETLQEDLACAPNLRHRQIIEATLAACRQVDRSLQSGVPADLLAVDLQVALDHLGDIVGLTTPDDVLDTIFSQFCLGK